jgi:hypothetical protein
MKRTLPDGPVPTLTRVSQRGRMWKEPGSNPMEFTGVAEHGVRRVSFSWRARFPVWGRIVWLSVVEAYDESGGRMDGRVWGLVPFKRTRGVEVQVGEVSRYLSEMPWTPYGIVANETSSGERSASGAFQVATSVGPEPTELMFAFDGEGDIASCFMADCPRQVGNRTEAFRRPGGESSPATPSSQAAYASRATAKSSGNSQKSRSCTGRVR